MARAPDRDSSAADLTQDSTVACERGDVRPSDFFGLVHNTVVYGGFSEANHHRLTRIPVCRQSRPWSVADFSRYHRHPRPARRGHW